MVKVKICGLKSISTVKYAVRCGVDYIGFVFFEKSPRFVDIYSVRKLTDLVPAEIKTVGLFVNASRRHIEKVSKEARLDYLQLHGQETPEQVGKLKDLLGIPIIKSIGIAEKSDLEQVKEFEDTCDQLLIDTKASTSMKLPGGNGIVFDWGLVSDFHFECPWLLAGGLTSKNVIKAIRISGANQVDVSSGIEKKFGVKDPKKMSEFIEVVKNDGKSGK